MPRKASSRKFQLTINNPADHNFSHERIKVILSEFSGLVYWCMCDEVGEQGTPHTHVYVVFKNSTMFDTLHGKFYGAHIEQANGSNRENRDYVRKEGKWLNDAKHETNLADTFEECLQLCTELAREGDAVLLSPACASWGMFPNYEVRGKMFKDYANNLKE